MVVMVVNNKAGTLTVNVDQDAFTRGISISENYLSSNPKPMLTAASLDNVWNITESWIPQDVHLVDGDNSGENYIVYSFYVRNGGNQDENLIFSIKVKGTRGLDETIRIKVYSSNLEEPRTYAKATSDGLPEPETIPFAANNTILEIVPFIKKDESVRISIIVWVEGEDPDTTNEKIGGTVNLEAMLKIYSE